jgi:hypothetical protein
MLVVGVKLGSCLALV